MVARMAARKSAVTEVLSRRNMEVISSEARARELRLRGSGRLSGTGQWRPGADGFPPRPFGTFFIFCGLKAPASGCRFAKEPDHGHREARVQKTEAPEADDRRSDRLCRTG